MKHFTALFKQLDQSNKTNDKISALVQYFNLATDDDKLWTIALLSHRRPRRNVKTTLLRMWAAEESGLPLWLLEDAYYVVGDLAETLSLVLPKSESKNDYSLSYWINYLRVMNDLEDEEKKN